MQMRRMTQKSGINRLNSLDESPRTIRKPKRIMNINIDTPEEEVNNIPVINYSEGMRNIIAELF